MVFIIVLVSVIPVFGMVDNQQMHNELHAVHSKYQAAYRGLSLNPGYQRELQALMDGLSKQNQALITKYYIKLKKEAQEADILGVWEEATDAEIHRQIALNADYQKESQKLMDSMQEESQILAEKYYPELKNAQKETQEIIKKYKAVN
jgi:hypothetical protein